MSTTTTVNTLKDYMDNIMVSQTNINDYNTWITKPATTNTITSVNPNVTWTGTLGKVQLEVPDSTVRKNISSLCRDVSNTLTDPSILMEYRISKIADLLDYFADMMDANKEYEQTVVG